MTNFLIFITILLDLITVYKIFKDDQYLLDNQKPKLIFIVLGIPILGALYGLNRVGFSWLGVLVGVVDPLKKPLKTSSLIAFFSGYKNSGDNFED